jgi:hypothetical protein
VPNGNGNGGMALPPGATLIDAGSMKLPPGATLVSGGTSSSSADMDAQLHAAYDNRPLWRKVMGLDPAPEDMSPQLTAYLAQQKQAAQKQVASQLQGVYSGYKQGAKAGAEAIPFMVVPEAAGSLAGGFAEGLGAGKILSGAANVAAQGLTSAGIAKSQGAGPVGTTAAGVLGAAAPALELASPAASTALESSAAKQYGQVLNATTKGNKYLSETQVVPGLLERGTTAVSMKGLQQTAQQSLAKFGQAIGDAWDDLPQGTSVELQPVWDKLEQSAQDALTIATPSGPKPTTSFAKRALDSVDQMKELLMDVAEQNPTTGKLEVPVDKLHQIRQTWDGVAALAKRYQGAELADYATGEVHGMAADAIREELGKQFPDIDALNKEFSFWKNVDKVVSDTITRRTGQAKPLGQKLAQAAGTAAGFATGGMGGAVLGREAMGALEKLTTSTAWGTVSAVMKDRLASALASGDTQAIIDLTSRMGASAAAQSSEEEEAPTQPYRQAVSER